MGAFSKIRDGLAFAFSPPAVIELGQANGFDLQLQDRGGLGHEKLMEARNQLLGMAMKNPKLVAVRPNGQDDSPQFKLEIDDVRAGALGVSLADINSVLATAWGGSYVNDFIQNGPGQEGLSPVGSPVPDAAGGHRHAGMSATTKGRWCRFRPSPPPAGSTAPPAWSVITVFRRWRSWGRPHRASAPAKPWPRWRRWWHSCRSASVMNGPVFPTRRKKAGAQAPALYAISLLVVFLSVAALYESWTIPFVNLLMLPLGLVGAVVAVKLRMFPNDIYLQIGLLTTIGLSTKNAILIIQFIKAQMHQGHELVEATLTAVKIRLRPVIMTSLAFFFGTLPLALTKGAGAAAQNAIGTAVTGGLLSATFIDLIFIPFFFVLVSRLFGQKEDTGEPACRHDCGGALI